MAMDRKITYLTGARAFFSRSPRQKSIANPRYGFFILLLILFISGCSWFEDKRVVSKPKVDSEMLLLIIKNRYQGEQNLKIIETDLALYEYLKEKKKDKT